jgi:transglutaminase-like putative cysteine protease/glutamine cyclotransferase
MRSICLWGMIGLLALGITGSAAAAPGDTLASLTAPACCSQGMTFDGEHLWVVDRMTDMMYRIDADKGDIVDSISAPGYVPRGLTWDGQRLWCVDAEEASIYAINPKTQVIETAIYCPVSNPADLAWDGHYLWIAGERSTEISQISPEDGTTIKSIPAPTRHATGLTFDGKYLWVADRYKDMIYMVTPDKGEVICQFDAPGPHAWGLAWDGKNLWNVDYQTDRLYKLVVDDGTPFVKLEPKEQSIDFLLQARNYGPGTVKTLDFYLAIPHDLNNQKLLTPVTFNPEPTDILTDKWGQKVAHFRFTDVAATEFKSVDMSVSAELYQNRYFVYPDKVGTLSDIPVDIRKKYLVDDTKFSMTDPVIQKAVKAAVGDETNPYWIARDIFDYLIDHMEYELAGGWNIAPAVLARGNGSCSEYSFVYIAMCRAAGLPARYAGSIVIRGDDASYDDVFHRWVEVYFPNYGWIPVDPSGGDQKYPADQAKYFGFLNNRFLITTLGGGGSEYLEWGYNANAHWTGIGKCKVNIEYFGEWSPLEDSSGDESAAAPADGACAPKK